MIVLTSLGLMLKGLIERKRCWAELLHIAHNVRHSGFLYQPTAIRFNCITIHLFFKIIRHALILIREVSVRVP